jgi:hypothetical protein
MDTRENSHENNFTKKQKLPKEQRNTDPKSFNINAFIDTGKVAIDFINYYFGNIFNIQKMINDNVIQTFTTLKYDSIEYKGNVLLELLQEIGTNHIEVLKIESKDSGSRRIDISVIGKLNEQFFSQTFLLCNKDNVWYLKNSILIIL